MKNTILSVIVAVAVLFTCTAAAAETAATQDATYQYLFVNMLNVMSSDGQNDTLKLQNATVWKVNDSLAGFLFEGDDWFIMGESLMDTGLIYKIHAQIPYNITGILAARMLAFTLSEVPDWDEFTATYTSSDSVLAPVPMTHYANTLNTGNADTMIFEFTRTNTLDLNDAANAFDMKNTILTMQALP